MTQPKIGITMGDPAGIGPEITVKMFSQEDIYSRCLPIVIGSKSVLLDIMNIIGLRGLNIHCIERIKDCKAKKNVINLLDLNNIKREDFEYGKVNQRAGKASGEFIAKVIQMALSNDIDAIVTNPIHKESFKLGGYGMKYAGHTEMLADLTGTRDYTMMLACGSLRVVHLSTHISLKEALNEVKKDRIVKVIKIANDACISLGIQSPKIAVAGINPHCGDGGIFGDEEITEIIPAVKETQAFGIDVCGPIPSDTVFAKVIGGVFDIVVAMYHDQGHIPVKTIGFQWNKNARSWGKMKGVNITLGLPVIRTSVDHGTAFGKAGKGKADYTSLYEALLYAKAMVEKRQSAAKYI